MYAKIKISGKIELLTGMHIGGSTEYSAIGAVDSPIIRDARTHLPMIPGSSLKGKMRTLLARKYGDGIASSKPDGDPDKIKRLFGSSDKGDIKISRLIFSDMVLDNKEDLINKGSRSVTEVKFENSINRATAVANPRQIERSIKGSVYKLDIIYDAYKDDELEEDFENIADGLKLLEYDYIGGSGSRGYGKVKITELDIDVVVGKVDDTELEKCRKIIKNNNQ